MDVETDGQVLPFALAGPGSTVSLLEAYQHLILNLRHVKHILEGENKQIHY